MSPHTSFSQPSAPPLTLSEFFFFPPPLFPNFCFSVIPPIGNISAVDFAPPFKAASVGSSFPSPQLSEAPFFFLFRVVPLSALPSRLKGIKRQSLGSLSPKCSALMCVLELLLPDFPLYLTAAPKYPTLTTALILRYKVLLSLWTQISPSLHPPLLLPPS